MENVRWLLRTPKGAIRRVVLAVVMLGQGSAEGALPFGPGEPAIDRVLEIRQKLLPPAASAADTPVDVVQWRNWRNWPNWSNWPNWNNFRNWRNW
jgi:hypothetical protein